jgi:hypothetical protein
MAKFSGTKGKNWQNERETGNKRKSRDKLELNTELEKSLTE